MTEGGFSPPTGPPAGWYPDPYDPSSQRYWDGSAWDMSSTAPGWYAGASDDYPDIGDWLDGSFRRAYRRWKAAGAIAVLTGPVSTVATYLALGRFADGLVITEDGVENWSNDRLVPVVVLLVVGSIVSAIGGLALIRLMLDTVDDEPSPRTTGSELAVAGRALLGGAAVLPRAIGWFIVLLAAFFAGVMVIVLLALVIGPFAILVALAAIPFAIWLAIKWAFLVIAIVDRRGAPFDRSSSTSRGRWWSTFGRLLLLGIIMWLVSLVIQMAGSLATGGGFAGLDGGMTIEIDSEGSFDPIVLDDELQFGVATTVVAVVTSILGTVLASSVTAVAMSVLYRTRNAR